MDMNIHEETLKIARNLIKKDPSLTDWVISKFPELKESEDEKIRRVIRGWIYTRPASFFDNGISKEEILAWLERQGEQKSAEWSEEDEKYLNFVIATIKTLQVKCTENEIKHHSNNQAAPYYAKVINWLKFIRPQKYVGYNPYKATVESIAEMCKHYDVANHSGLRDFYDNVKVKCKEAIEYDKKYSQRQWRPSNKQLNALDSVLQYGQISNNSKEDLNSLYNDLKQL